MSCGHMSSSLSTTTSLVNNKSNIHDVEDMDENNNGDNTEQQHLLGIRETTQNGRGLRHGRVASPRYSSSFFTFL